MGRVLGSWSGMRKYLEQEMLAECLNGRIRYGCTTYPGMDDCKIFEICVDGEQIKRFSWETVNTYFINNGYKQNTKPYGRIEYWSEYWQLLNKIPLTERTEYTDGEFCDALNIYRNQDIINSLHSENPLIKMFAVLDRRTGKRALRNIKENIKNEPQWLQKFYKLRTEAEDI